MCELLNTVSLLKSDFIKEIIKQIKLVTTKINCKNVNLIIFMSNKLKLLKKFLNET